jgi:hypothetical protein
MRYKPSGEERQRLLRLFDTGTERTHLSRTSNGIAAWIKRNVGATKCATENQFTLVHGVIVFSHEMKHCFRSETVEIVGC